MNDYDRLDNQSASDPCPSCGTQSRKTYTFGSSLSAETDVVVFAGCDCAVAIRHDPIGTYPSVASYHPSYEQAAGVAVLHRDLAKAPDAVQSRQSDPALSGG